MAHRGYSVIVVCANVQNEFGPNHGIGHRVMSDYLNGHKEISSKHRGMLAKVLGVRPELV